MIKELKKHLKNTSLEQLKKEWDDVSEYSNIGPSASEFIANQRKYAKIQNEQACK